jgi:hypothetical protein
MQRQLSQSGDAGVGLPPALADAFAASGIRIANASAHEPNDA